MTNMNAAGWFDIYVGEMERAETFYKTFLDADLEDMADPTSGETEMKSFVAQMGPCGAAAALVKAPYAKRGPSGTQVIRPKFSIGAFGFVTLAQDTEGNMIGFNSLT